MSSPWPGDAMRAPPNPRRSTSQKHSYDSQVRPASSWFQSTAYHRRPVHSTRAATTTSPAEVPASKNENELQNRLNRRDEEISELREQLQDAKASKDKYKVRAASLERHAREAEEKLNSAKELQERLKLVSEYLEQWDQEKLEWKSQHAETTRQLQQTTAETETLERQNHDLQKSMDSEIQKLNSALEEMRTEKSNLEEIGHDQHLRLEKAKEDFKTLESEKQSLDQQVIFSVGENNKLRQSNTQLERAEVDLKQKITGLEHLKHELEYETISLTSKNTSLLQSNKQLRCTKGKLQGEVWELWQQDLGRKVLEMQALMEAAQQQRDTLHQQRDTLKQQRNGLQQERDDLQQQLTAAHQGLTEHGKEITNLKKELRQLEEARKEDGKKARRQEIKISGEKSNLETEIEQLKRTQKAGKDDFKKRMDKIQAKYQDDLTKLQDKNLELEKSLHKTSDDAKRLEGDAQGKDEQITSIKRKLEQEIDGLKQARNTDQANFQQQVLKLNTEHQQELGELQSEKSKVDANVCEKSSDVQRLTEELRGKDEEVASTTRELKQEIEQLKQARKTDQDHFQQKVFELNTKHQQELGELQSEKSKADANLREKSSDVQRLIEEGRSKDEKIASTARELKQEVNQLKQNQKTWKDEMQKRMNELDTKKSADAKRHTEELQGRDGKIALLTTELGEARSEGQNLRTANLQLINDFRQESQKSERLEVEIRAKTNTNGLLTGRINEARSLIEDRTDARDKAWKDLDAAKKRIEKLESANRTLTAENRGYLDKRNDQASRLAECQSASQQLEALKRQESAMKADYEDCKRRLQKAEQERNDQEKQSEEAKEASGKRLREEVEKHKALESCLQNQLTESLYAQNLLLEDEHEREVYRHALLSYLRARVNEDHFAATTDTPQPDLSSDLQQSNSELQKLKRVLANVKNEYCMDVESAGTIEGVEYANLFRIFYERVPDSRVQILAQRKIVARDDAFAESNSIATWSQAEDILGRRCCKELMDFFDCIYDHHDHLVGLLVDGWLLMRPSEEERAHFEAKSTEGGMGTEKPAVDNPQQAFPEQARPSTEAEEVKPPSTDHVQNGASTLPTPEVSSPEEPPLGLPQGNSHQATHAKRGRSSDRDGLQKAPKRPRNYYDPVQDTWNTPSSRDPRLQKSPHSGRRDNWRPNDRRSGDRDDRHGRYGGRR